MKIGPETAALVSQCAAQLVPPMRPSFSGSISDEQRQSMAREAVLMALAILREVDAYVDSQFVEIRPGMV